jgi:hypothetical protein
MAIAASARVAAHSETDPGQNPGSEKSRQLLDEVFGQMLYCHAMFQTHQFSEAQNRLCFIDDLVGSEGFEPSPSCL